TRRSSDLRPPNVAGTSSSGCHGRTWPSPGTVAGGGDGAGSWSRGRPVGLTSAGAELVQRERSTAEDGADRERAAGVADRADGEDLVEQQALVRGQVRHHRLDEEVGLARDEVAGHHRGDRRQPLLELAG